MQPRLLKVGDSTFERAEFDGENKSGFEPVGDKVLVLPDSAAEVTGGGIQLTAEHVERTTLAAETGVIIAAAAGAFEWNSDRTRPWSGIKPKIGERVYMQRYSGQVMMGKDEKFYRVMTDVCIAAVEVLG